MNKQSKQAHTVRFANAVSGQLAPSAMADGECHCGVRDRAVQGARRARTGDRR